MYDRTRRLAERSARPVYLYVGGFAGGRQTQKQAPCKRGSREALQFFLGCFQFLLHALAGKLHAMAELPYALAGKLHAMAGLPGGREEIFYDFVAGQRRRPWAPGSLYEGDVQFLPTTLH